ncbi:transporter substrate-binding domain-containing protein [Alkalimonas collagenimarina]|uniref:Transporter substrate-binding domain-containing protein n=1 Tax=Alkalimonas collagenimarina TaxID=400390 RepID=A0ABT9H2V8_9GAMM|nr:transporter substrate-binding domain-containing protein [Alkalimonas collagenimarina]MDP4537645.1 transporter substrate-binding domain-containing protein [Alkalimonas collagenimarina]
MVHSALWLYFILLFFSASSFAVSRPSLIWCLDHTPPRKYYEYGKDPYGPMVDLMQDVATKLNTKLEFTVPTPTSRCLLQLERGEVDVVTGLLYTPERDNRYWLLPYDIAKPESHFINKHRTPAENQELRITLIQSGIYSEGFQESLLKAGHQVLLAPSIDDALADLYHGTTDVFVGPEHITLLHISRNGRYQQSLIVAPQDKQADFEAHIAISKNGRYADRYQAFREALEQIRAEGKYQFYQ